MGCLRCSSTGDNVYCCTTNKHHGFEGVLATADSLANATQYNDSAVKLLELVKDSMLKQDESTRMAYKPMRIKAYDRLWQTSDDEDEILAILEYYEKKGNNLLLPVALYYAGRHSVKQHDIPTALKYFHRAHEMISKDSSNYMNIKICIPSKCYMKNQENHTEKRWNTV